MKKKNSVWLTFILLFTGALLYLGNDFFKNRTLITPYPYAFKKSYEDKFLKVHSTEIASAEDAQILIVGDRMGKSLSPYLPAIQDSFNKVSSKMPHIYNWSAENEGLFRTLNKLNKLKKFPPIIIYFGASSELQEQKFDISDKKNILKNFTTFDNEKLISLIITFPWLSKIFYKSVHYFDLDEFKEYKNMLSAPQKLEEKEIAFKIFQYETRELIDLVKNKKSNLIFITTPINLEVAPKEVCAHANTADILSLQQEITGMIKEGAYKLAYPKVRELTEATFVNARSYYLLGQVALGAGDMKIARNALLKAAVFDCSNWRGNAVYNAIIKNLAHKNLTPVIDFDQLMSSQLSKEGLYFDDIFPQNIFYQNAIKELSDVLKKILIINE